MMQDFPRLLAPTDKVGFTAFERKSCFTCVKNSPADAAAKFAGGLPPESIFTCEADIYANFSVMIRKAGEASGFVTQARH